VSLASAGGYFLGSQNWGGPSPTITTSLIGLGDVDGDGNPDLIPSPNQYVRSNVTSFGSLEQSALLTWYIPIMPGFNLPYNNYPDYSRNNHMIYADVNGDQRADVISVDYEPMKVRIGLSNRDSQGKFYFGDLKQDSAGYTYSVATQISTFPTENMATVLAADVLPNGKKEKAVVGITFNGDVWAVPIR
jgi:hypothetical protein